jgi:hypothetical protein
VACVAGSAHPAARPAAHRPQQEQQQQEPQPAQDTPEVKQGWFEWNKYGPCRINYYQVRAIRRHLFCGVGVWGRAPMHCQPCQIAAFPPVRRYTPP